MNKNILKRRKLNKKFKQKVISQLNLSYKNEFAFYKNKLFTGIVTDYNYAGCDICFYKNGLIHRDFYPATYSSIKKIKSKQFYKNGSLTRDVGPASVYYCYNGKFIYQWYIDDNYITSCSALSNKDFEYKNCEKEFEKRIKF